MYTLNVWVPAPACVSECGWRNAADMKFDVLMQGRVICGHDHVLDGSADGQLGSEVEGRPADYLEVCVRWPTAI
jgi:hypothetical protein